MTIAHTHTGVDSLVPIVSASHRAHVIAAAAWRRSSSADTATDPLIPLTAEGLVHAVEALGARDPALAGVVTRHGPPPMWARRPGFAALVEIVLGQQVSLASARAAYARLQAAAGRVTPHRVAASSEAALRRAGLTRQKASYCREIARRVVDGRLDLGRLPGLDDDEVRAELLAVPGIGTWTADIYLLMALRRRDIWPDGDLALATAVRRLKRLRRVPSRAQLRRIADRWAPWRAVAARLLWHDYLSSRR